MPSRNTIEIVINAKDNASDILKGVIGTTQDLGKATTLAIAGAVAAGTAALAGFAVKGYQEFSTFQKGMAEVFTLLPGISGDAMKEMEDQVLHLSQRFGVLPNETIPAFYEALSAGIPQENVFTFVEVANKAAIAGVTDLTTAVNGISSAMNAYGYDVLSAEKASDIMFQTVKLGKTTFEELSNSLYNVSPTAAALGVTFEDLNAQIAAITAQGVPTSVATNQMRQMFVELSKAGGKTADIFQQLAGKTFKQFIAEGGNTQQALQLLEKYAADTGVGINDLFSSVEAGSAALSLTGRNTERFTAFLDAMATSAGSTDTAFKTMSKTASFQLNRALAKISTLFIEIGRKVEPFLTPLIEGFGDLVSVIISVLQGMEEWDAESFGFTGALADIGEALFNAIGWFMDFAREIQNFIGALMSGVPFMDALGVTLRNIFGEDVGNAIMGVIGFIDELFKTIGKIIEPIRKWFEENVKLEDILLTVATIIGSFIIPALVGIVTAAAPVVAVILGLVGVFSIVRQAWENDTFGIRTFITETLIPAVMAFIDLFKTGDWSTFGETVLKPILDGIADLFWDNLATPIGEALGSIDPQWYVPIATGVLLIAGAFALAKIPTLVTAITTALTALLTTGFLPLIPIIALVGAILWAYGTNALGVRDRINELGASLRKIPGLIRDIMQAIYDISAPLAEFMLGLSTFTGIDVSQAYNALKSLQQTASSGKSALGTSTFTPSQFTAPSVGQNQTPLPGIVPVVSQKAEQDFFNKLGTELTNFLNGLTGKIPNTGNVSPFGAANGMPYVPQDMNMRVHRGERILTAQENEDYSGANRNNSPSIVIQNINLGDIRNQADADEKAKMFVNGLKAQGFEVS